MTYKIKPSVALLLALPAAALLVGVLVVLPGQPADPPPRSAAPGATAAAPGAEPGGRRGGGNRGAGSWGDAGFPGSWGPLRAQAVRGSAPGTGSGGPGAEWPLLVDLLADGTRILFPAPARDPLPDRMCWLAADALVRLGARDLAPRIRGGLGGEDPRGRVAAGLVLLSLGEDLPHASALLAEALGLPDEADGTGWLERTALALAAGAVPPSRVTDALVEAVAARLSGLRAAEAGRALLRLGPGGRERARTVLAGSGTAYERCGVLEALAAEPALGAGLEPEIRRVAEADENSWNRRLAARALAGTAPGGGAVTGAGETAPPPEKPPGGR